MINLTYPAAKLTERVIEKLERIVEEHPGDENVELHMTSDGHRESCRVLRLNVSVDGSPEFLLKAMGLLDST